MLLSLLAKRSLTQLSSSKRSLSTTSSPVWATIDPLALGSSTNPYFVQNICDGQWTSTNAKLDIPHPMDRDAHPIFTISDTSLDEIQPFVESLRKCPKTGLHNPLKNPERYLQYGEITRKVQHLIQEKIFTFTYFQRVSNTNIFFLSFRMTFQRQAMLSSNLLPLNSSLVPSRPASLNLMLRLWARYESQQIFLIISLVTTSVAWRRASE